MKNRAVFQRAPRRAGFALVIVLCIVVLLVALAVGFLVRASSERSAASGYHASVLARQLADTVTSLVQGQINAASTQGSNVDWVSQPGMVRTFDTSGNLIKAYKLYSGSNMITTSLNIADDVPPANWASQSALYVDLNAPIEVRGVKNFPILDPTLALSDTTSAPQGYSLNAPPGATTYQPAPMPTRWLYVLRDGTIVSPAGSGSQASVAGEQASNPIIGRVAFWTDDETCKVNVNTASEGTFWDVPKARTNQEYALADNQPAQREYQRYPGHPAMTSLSAVFTGSAFTPAQIFQVAPRIVDGGSYSGSSRPTAALTPDTDRLYSSVDELVFDPSRANNANLTKSQLEQAKFFLTAHSRAPETNLYNLPRIACWPIFKGLASDRVTAFDKLIAFCASTGTGTSQTPYYFQREDANSATNDLDSSSGASIPRNAQLYSYLQYLTSQPVPGFGGKFSDKYLADRDQILTEIFDYIRCTNLHDDLLSANKQFTTYWPSTSATRNSIPTGYGWVAPAQYTPPGGTVTMGVGRTYTLSEFAIGFICNADGNDITLGSNIPVAAAGTGNCVLSGTALAPNEKYIQAILIPELFSPMLGFVALCPDIRIKISGLDTLKINGISLFPNSDGDTKYDWNWPALDSTRIWGGNPSWRFSLYGKGSPDRVGIPGDHLGGSWKNDPTSPTNGFRDLYPFIGTPIKISTAAGTMTMSEGTLKLEIYAKSSLAPDSANLLQTINLKLPSATLPIPKLVDKPVLKNNSTAPTMSPQSFWAFSANGTIITASGPPPTYAPGRLYFLGKETGGNGNVGSGGAQPGQGSFLLQEYDVVRSVLPAHGDFRLVAASNVVQDDIFVPLSITDYNNATKNMVCDLSSASTGGDQGFHGGKYVSTLTYDPTKIPDIPISATGSNTPEASGDYDNAISLAMDGPLTNKPDEGANFRTVNSHPYFDASGEEYVGGATFFSPNRQIPSPGMFGSLPTGVKANVPWRTLLFRPQSSHPGSNSPKDHLLLDLFWMPVVEPYAISDRFSTAGKINMNYQILPFTYIDRSTGIQALLKSEKLTVLPNAKSTVYKTGAAGLPDAYRVAIDPTETLSQFKAKFDSGDVFKSASEICDLHIVPLGQTLSSMSTFWSSNALTGDNSRERIYTTLYPRLTTRSNTYTVHFRVQSLKKNPMSVAGIWTEGKDVVTGEYRGSTTLERFIDANNSKIPDYAANPSLIPSLKTLDTFYKWRVVENRQFAP